MKTLEGTAKRFAPWLMMISLYALPIWYFSAYNLSREYAGYSWWYAVPVGTALLFTWVSKVPDGQVSESIALVSLLGLQLLLVFLLDNLVGPGVYARPWLLLALPATVWVALLIVANRTNHWLTRGTRNAQSRAAYCERMRLYASTGVTWLTLLALITVVATYWRPMRAALDDYMWFFLGAFSAGGVGFWVSAAIERRFNPSPSSGYFERIVQDGIPEPVALEVQYELDRLSRMRMDVMLAVGFVGIGAALVVFLAFGHAADGYALGLFTISQVLGLVAIFAVGPWYKRRWQREVVSNRLGIQDYRKATDGTPLGFPAERK